MIEEVMKLLKNIESPRIAKAKIKKVLKKKEIDNLVSRSILKVEHNYPQQCEHEFCNSPIEYEEKTNKVIIRCLEEPSHRRTENKDKYIVFELNIKKIFDDYFATKLKDIKIVDYDHKNGFYKFECTYKDLPITFLFSLLPDFSDKQLFEAIGDSLLTKKPIWLAIKDTTSNEDSTETILMKMPLGNLIYPIYIQNMNNKQLTDQIMQWLGTVSDLYQLETEILGNIDNKERAMLISSIDTNPKYLLSSLTRLRNYKLNAKKKNSKWKNFEDLVAIIFRNLYSSDVRFGGYQQEWENVPDNVFFVRQKNKNQITCVVDAKFSFLADLSSEKTEKYLNYLKAIRKHPATPNKLALVFVVLETKSDSSVKEFFKRIEKHLEQGEYCIVLPIQFLEFIVYIYLGSILKGKINLSHTDFNTLLEEIFDKDYLDSKDHYKIYPNLYNLKSDYILEEIKRVCKESSSVEKIFAEIFKR